MFCRFAQFRGFRRPGSRVAAAAAVAVVALTATALPAAAKTRRPTRIWGPGIEAIAHEVEELRGLEFKRPVPIQFVGDDRRAYQRQGFSPGDQDEYEAEGRHLQALGLVAPGADLSPLWSSNSGMGVLGYYDVRGPRIIVFQDGLTTFSRVIVAHELTHALDDQHFRFVRRADVESEPAVAAFRAVVEGDAQRVELEYLARLTRDERRAVRDGFRAVSRRYRNLTGIDYDLEWFGVTGGLPYLLGREYTRAVLTQDGPRALGRLFEATPKDDSAVLDPVAPGPAWSYLGTRGVAQRDRDGRPQYPGAGEVYLILASRVPADVAYEAANRADGSSLTFYRRGTTTCARFALSSDRFGMIEVKAAADGWVAASGGHASVAVEGAVATIDSCGGFPPLSPGSITVPATQLAARTRAVTTALKQGATEEDAACVGVEVLRDLQYRDSLDARFVDVVYRTDDSRRQYRAVAQRAFEECGVVRAVRDSRPR